MRLTTRSGVGHQDDVACGDAIGLEDYVERWGTGIPGRTGGEIPNANRLAARNDCVERNGFAVGGGGIA